MLTKTQKYPLPCGSGYFVLCEKIAFCGVLESFSYFRLSATATATATVAPTIGLLPMPRKPIISTEFPAFDGFPIGA